MYHPRFKGSHYEMGRKLGLIFKQGKVKLPIRLDDFQTRHGLASVKILQQVFPEVCDEIRGLTDALNFDFDMFAAWMLCMGCCMYNLDETGNAEIRGCTALSFTDGRQVLYARNNDLPPFLKKGSKSIYYQPENGNRFILNTSSFINGEEGINEYGLVAAMTFVMPKLAEIRPGLNSVFLVRYILEKCRSVDEGLTALCTLPVASGCNMLLMEKSGKMVVAECHPAKMVIRRPEKSGTGEYIVTVNHFTSEEMWRYDVSSRNLYFSDLRYKTARSALHDMDTNDATGYLMELMSGQRGFMCQYARDLDFTTIWSSIFDLTGERIFRCENNPQRLHFIQDKRLFQ